MFQPEVWLSGVLSHGASPKGAARTVVSFYNTRLTRGALPQPPAPVSQKDHMQVTRRERSLRNRSEQSKLSPWRHLRASVSSQEAVVAARVRWRGSPTGSERDPWHSQALVCSGQSSPHRTEVPLILASLSKCPDWWFWVFWALREGFPLHPRLSAQ